MSIETEIRNRLDELVSYGLEPRAILARRDVFLQLLTANFVGDVDLKDNSYTFMGLRVHVYPKQVSNFLVAV